MKLDYKQLQEELRERGRRYTLDNGVRVLAEHVPGLGLALGKIRITPGSHIETEDDLGTLHLLEHLQAQGSSKGYPSAEKKISKASLLGMALNGFTSLMGVEFPVEGNNPSLCLLADKFPEAFSLVCDGVYNPLLLPEEIEKERAVIQRERMDTEHMADDLLSHAVHKQMQRRIYSANPHLFRNPIGTEQTIGSIDAAKLKAYHQKLFTGKNTTVSLFGELDSQGTIEQTVRQLLEEILPGEEMEDVRVQPEVPYLGTEELHLESPLPGAAQVQIYFQIGHRFADDFVPKSLLEYILGGGQFNLLQHNLRERRSLVYDIGATTLGHDATQFIQIRYTIDPLKIDESLEAVEETLDKVRCGDFDEAMVEALQACFLPQIVDEFSRPGWILKELDAQRKSEKYGLQGSWLRTVDQHFSTTKKDIVAVANKYLTNDRLVVIVS